MEVLLDLVDRVEIRLSLRACSEAELLLDSPQPASESRVVLGAAIKSFRIARALLSARARPCDQPLVPMSHVGADQSSPVTLGACRRGPTVRACGRQGAGTPVSGRQAPIRRMRRTWLGNVADVDRLLEVAGEAGRR